MQHSPSIVAMLIVFSILLGIMWLGGRILAKWHPVYAGKRARAGYWLVTALAVVILIFSRWLRPLSGFPGEWFRYFIYAAYVWMVGLVFMLVVLLAGHVVRLLVRKLGQQSKPLQAEKMVPGGLTRREFLQGAITVVPAVPFAMSAYGVIGGDTQIVANRYTLSFGQLPLALDGFTIAQISDTHIGPFFGMDKLERVLDMVRQDEPQLLAITGDLVDDLDLLAPTIKQLTDFQAELPHGIFFCWGNHEYFRDISRIRKALYSSPITVLENSQQAVKDGLYLAGVDYPWGKNKAEQETKRQDYFAQSVSKIPADAFTVLLTHHPDFLDNAFMAGVPLSLAGHTHGGQVAIFGTSVLPVQYKYMKGMFRQNGSYGYVSAGAGHWLPLRIGCPAEVSFFKLKRGI
ncbi:3',5'-cyclic adenosine monophosphate phosphodiesterase CpdA [Sporomusa silvacetica DSM 10669]|uniref:3',5'-cyclic adenosine monophosphate phosphodiesterase CpdA n=1 Tax=Sporomusa silvacetica DSM 10669 TaxID=1123289 RepID=A0ABZ3IED3_9FIRM|nr:metallophosphoesterase [Sporomusa silvacetica]OZC22575.1 putative metallophosphoesterase [Sporomusa silvacetica DSM 10669]